MCVCVRMQVCGHLCVGGVNVCVCVCVLNQYSNLACCLNWMLKDFGEDFINVNYVSMYSMYVCNVCKTNQWKNMVKKKNKKKKHGAVSSDLISGPKQLISRRFLLPSG